MIDFDKLEQDILDGAASGLYRGAKIVARRAKQRAPVRNIFGRSYQFRPKTKDELAADFGAMPDEALATMLEKGPGNFVNRWRGPKRVRSDMRMREESRAEEYLELYDAGDESPLSRQGASEVRTKRANYTVGNKTTVGGRLRGEIYVTKPMAEGDVAESWVISPTPYAKYMEFGTRHNRAYPFLRPALEESRADIVSQVSRAVAAGAKRGSGGNVKLEIKVRL